MCQNQRLDIPKYGDVDKVISIHNTFVLSDVPHPLCTFYKISKKNKNFHITFNYLEIEENKL